MSLARRLLRQPLVVGLGFGAGCVLLVGALAWGWDLADWTAGEGRKAAAAVKAPRVGDRAPDFTLPTIADPRHQVTLSRLIGRRPVVLVFGSFSCLVFVNHVEQLERLYQDNKGRAEFLFVNVQEAGHVIPGLEFVVEGRNAGFGQSAEDRRRGTRRAMELKGLTIPAVIDPDGAAAEAPYDGYPTRLVVLDAKGRIALDQGQGLPGEEPWDLGAIDRWLKAQAGE